MQVWKSVCLLISTFGSVIARVRTRLDVSKFACTGPVHVCSRLWKLEKEPILESRMCYRTNLWTDLIWIYMHVFRPFFVYMSTSQVCNRVDVDFRTVVIYIWCPCSVEVITRLAANPYSISHFTKKHWALRKCDAVATFSVLDMYPSVIIAVNKVYVRGSCVWGSGSGCRSR